MLSTQDWDRDSATTAFGGPVEFEEQSTSTSSTHNSPTPLERDVELADSTDSDLACSIEEEIFLLHRHSRISPREKARTVVQLTAWPSGSLFSSGESDQEELPTTFIARTPNPPTSETPKGVDQLVTTLVLYSPSTGSSRDTSTASTPCGSPAYDHEDSPTRTVMASLIQDMLAIASIEHPVTIMTFLHALQAMHRELTLVLNADGLGQASSRYTTTE